MKTVHHKIYFKRHSSIVCVQTICVCVFIIPFIIIILHLWHGFYQSLSHYGLAGAKVKRTSIINCSNAFDAIDVEYVQLSSHRYRENCQFFF